MAGCPLCILGVPQQEHTPERWANITDEEFERIKKFWAKHGTDSFDAAHCDPEEWEAPHGDWPPGIERK